MNFDEYWADPRFAQKRPNLRGSKKLAFGDNIYHRANPNAPWQQLDSHHSFADGTPNQANINNDTQANRVLISRDFAYWGGAGPRIPAKFRDYGGVDLCAGRGHKQKLFSDAFITDFITWLNSLNVSGYVGMPIDWDQTP